MGGGPAGLAAAEVMAGAGLRVAVADRMPSLGRKFLMAGKSGLNLTMDEPPDQFRAAFRGDWLAQALVEFDNRDVVAWAESLGQTTFTGTTGRVFPVAMKASPLLRAWLARLGGLGVTFRTRWRWTGWDPSGAAVFATPEGGQTVAAGVTVMALGGGSWARLGSDGAWVGPLGVRVVPFAPSNMALRRVWSGHMAPHFGAPLKNVALNGRRGEAVISATGLEGSLVYHLSQAIRDGAALALDLLPGITTEEAARRLTGQPRKLPVGRSVARAWGLTPAAQALLMELAPARDRDTLARAVKQLPLTGVAPAPLDEA
ncbi:MAG: TIGR03862 family flavoprotein, partial [Pseudomonadota bacterium]